MLYAVACSTAIVIEFLLLLLLLLLLIQDDSFYVFFIISLLLLFPSLIGLLLKEKLSRRDETRALSLTRSGGSGDGNSFFLFFQHPA